MPDIKLETHRSGQVTLDANGNGTVILTPDPYWSVWVVSYVVVKTSQPLGTTPVPRADTWLNDSQVFDNYHGGTSDGNLDVGAGRIVVNSDDQLLVVFGGGRPGDTATAVAYGMYTRTIGWPDAG